MMHDRRDRSPMRVRGTIDRGHYRRGSYVDSRNDYRKDYGMDRRRDYRRDYRMDNNYDYEDYGNNDMRDNYDYADDEWELDLTKWIKRLKRKDRFNSEKDKVISQAKNMGVNFQDYTEDEFYATYLMMVSDFPSIANEPRVYMSMAQSWLDDEDVAVEPSEKLCIYYYQIVEGEE